MARRIWSDKPGLDVVHRDAAGIDIGSREHYVAVGTDRDAEAVRVFGCFTTDLRRMAEWLNKCGIKTVVMQSTGVYWIPVYDVLEQYGLEVWLVNAQDTKNLPGLLSPALLSEQLLPLPRHNRGLGEHVAGVRQLVLPPAVQLAEVGPVIPFPQLQKLEQLEVGPVSRLLNNYAENVPAASMLEHAELLQPREVREDLFEVSIQGEKVFVDGQPLDRFHEAARFT